MQYGHQIHTLYTLADRPQCMLRARTFMNSEDEICVLHTINQSLQVSSPKTRCACRPPCWLCAVHNMLAYQYRVQYWYCLWSPSSHGLHCPETRGPEARVCVAAFTLPDISPFNRLKWTNVHMAGSQGSKTTTELFIVIFNITAPPPIETTHIVVQTLTKMSC